MQKPTIPQPPPKLSTKTMTASSSLPRRSILKNSPGDRSAYAYGPTGGRNRDSAAAPVPYQSPFSLIHQLNNSACALINQHQHHQHQHQHPLQQSEEAISGPSSLSRPLAPPSSPPPIASESFRCALKVIKACLQAGPAGIWSNPSVREACGEAATLASRVRHSLDALHYCDGKAMYGMMYASPSALHGTRPTSATGDDMNSPLPIDLLELNSYSLELHSVYVLYNMALAARLSAATPDAISLQLYDYALQSSHAIADRHRRHRLHRLVLLGMIDIYSSIDGYQDDVANLLDRLLMEEIHHLVDCPAASAAA